MHRGVTRRSEAARGRRATRVVAWFVFAGCALHLFVFWWQELAGYSAVCYPALLWLQIPPWLLATWFVTRDAREATIVMAALVTVSALSVPAAFLLASLRMARECERIVATPDAFPEHTAQLRVLASNPHRAARIADSFGGYWECEIWAGGERRGELAIEPTGAWGVVLVDVHLALSELRQ